MPTRRRRHGDECAAPCAPNRDFSKESGMLGKRLSLKKRPKVGVDHSEDIISNATPSGLVEAGLPTPIPASVPSRPPSPLLCSDEEVAEVGAIPVASASKPEEKESESEESAVEEADPDESPEQLSQEGIGFVMIACSEVLSFLSSLAQT